jgi:dihydrofolate reductase
MIILIAAIGEQNELGINNDLLWHLPNDFKRFKAITTGHYIIMGRKTFESFPKPLPNRTHIIITRNKNYKVPENCIVVNSLTEAIGKCPKNENIFIIGGGEIYKQSIEIANCLEVTRVHSTFKADTFFPEINLNNWELINSEFQSKDEKHEYDFTFQTFTRK